MENIFEQRKKSMRFYGSKIEGLMSRLDNKNASIEDSFISGSDYAKLIQIEILRNELKKDLDFILKTQQAD